MKPESEKERPIAEILNEWQIERIQELEQLNKELTEALERALSDFKTQNWTDETYDIIESAIAKSKSL